MKARTGEKEVRITKRGTADDGFLCRKSMFEISKSQINICPTEEKIWLCKAEKERSLYPIHKSFFGIEEGRDLQGG